MTADIRGSTPATRLATYLRECGTALGDATLLAAAERIDELEKAGKEYRDWYHERGAVLIDLLARAEKAEQERDEWMRLHNTAFADASKMEADLATARGLLFELSEAGHDDCDIEDCADKRVRMWLAENSGATPSQVVTPSSKNQNTPTPTTTVVSPTHTQNVDDRSRRGSPE